MMLATSHLSFFITSSPHCMLRIAANRTSICIWASHPGQLVFVPRNHAIAKSYRSTYSFNQLERTLLLLLDMNREHRILKSL